MNQPSKSTFCTVSVVCCLLALAVAVVFGQTVQHDFINFDDDIYVYNNPHIAHGFTGHALAWSFSTFHASNWHPLTWLSHALDCQLYGAQNAAGHHLTNVALHAIVAVLLLLLLWQMTGDLWPSAFVAAVFALHPLRAESVAWVAERKDLLCGLFFILTLAAYVHYVRHPFAWGRHLLVLGAFALGLMAKPMLVTLPFLLLLLDYWPLGRMSALKLASPKTWRALLVEKIPLLALAAASCAVTPLAQRQAMIPMDVVPLSARIANAVVAYVAYIGQFFYPSGLAVFYPYPSEGLPTWKIVVGVAALVIVSAVALLGRRRMPYLFVGWFWYLGMLVPVIGLMQVGSQAMADRYTYLPQIGLCVALAWGAAKLAAGWRYERWAYGVASALVLVCLATCAYRRTAFWRNNETLWNRAIACTTGNVFAHNNLGAALASEKNVDAAIAHFRKATAIAPTFAISYENLGVALEASGKSEEAAAAYRRAELSPYFKAIAQYQKALKIRPNSCLVHNNLGNALAACGHVDEATAEYRTALKINPNYASAHSNLANILAGQGRNDEAIAEYKKAIALDPNRADAHNNFGAVLADQGRLGEAIAKFQKALDIEPDFADAHGNLGTALSKQGKIADAMIHWREAVRLQPSNPRAVNRLAWAMATRPEPSIRNGAEAVELAQWAVQLSHSHEPVPLDTLAAAYAQVGRFADATKTAKKALDLASRRADKELAASIKTKIALYEAHTPFLDEGRPSPAVRSPSEREKTQ